MPQSAPSFSVEDLLAWIDQSVECLQVLAGPREQVVSSLGFEMMLCAAVASAIPGASMCMVEAGISEDEFTRLASILGEARPLALPASPQRFAIQFQDILINGSGVIHRSSLDEMVRQAYQDELELRAPSLMAQSIQVRYQTFQPEDLTGFVSGTWTQFIMQELGARYRSHLAAGQLEQSTGLANAQDNKSSPRRM